MSARPDRNGYWPQTRRLSAWLLLLWLAVTLAVSLFGPLWLFDFMGWPFGFWSAAQGALGIYCLIVWVYAWAMDRLDAQHARPDPD